MPPREIDHDDRVESVVALQVRTLMDERKIPAILKEKYQLEDIAAARRVLGMLIIERKTISEIAESFDKARQSIYNWLDDWKESGLYEDIITHFIEPLIMGVDFAETQVLAEWPQVVLGVLAMAKSGRSEYVRLQSAEWLRANVVEPLRGKVNDPGAEERDYASSVNAQVLEINPLPPGHQSQSSQPHQKASHPDSE